MTPSHIDLTHEWYGWRQRGRYLVSDDGQRMTVERLRGLLWRDHNELYLNCDRVASSRNAAGPPPFRSRSSW